ncbi:MAG: leucine-rich repeat protein [Clostridia bacterium]|nr:leucine-rich repeat protein [Clostridia bacterium]
MKNVITILLVSVLLFVLVPVQAVVAEEFTEGAYHYTVTDGEATITLYTGNDRELFLPETLGGYPVTGLSSNAFLGGTIIYTIHIHAGLVNIEEGALNAYIDLQNIYVHEDNPAFMDVDGVVFTKDGTTLFSFPQWRDVAEFEVPAEVTKIAGYAFANAQNLETVTLHEGLLEIGNGAFSGCSRLNSPVLPASLQRIGYSVFERCFAISEFTLASGNANFSTIDGMLCSADGKTILIYPCGKSGTEYTIPESVTAIGDYAFSGESLVRTLNIGSQVTSIGAFAFYRAMGLSRVNFSEGLLTIGERAFDSSAITTLELPAGLLSIGERAFSSCTYLQQNSIVLPASLQTVGAGAFDACPVKDYAVEEGNTAFLAVDGVLFNADATRLIAYPVGRTDSSYTIPDGVVEIGDYAFARTRAGSVNLPGGLVEIGNGAFTRSQLSSITIPDSVKSVGEEAFANSFELDGATIGKGVEKLGDKAFYSCTQLTRVQFNGAPPAEFGEKVFWYYSDFGSEIIMEQIVLYYTSAYKAQWAPNDETEYLGYPIRARILPFIGIPSFDGFRMRQEIYIDESNYTISNLPPNRSGADLVYAVPGYMSLNMDEIMKTGDIADYDGMPYTLCVAGDLNGDGIAGSDDAALILRAIVKLETLDMYQTLAANTFRSDSGYSAADAARVLRYVVRLEYTVGVVNGVDTGA